MVRTSADDERHAIWAVGRSDGIDANGDGVWPWWSITKTVIAAAALRLNDLGLLELDAPTCRYDATLRQLLAHTGGVPSYTRLPAYRAAVERREAAWPLDDMLRHALAEPSDFAPGQGWSYSNTGYAIVRRAIEAATGRLIGHALRELVFDPLGLTTAAVATSDDRRADGLLVEERYDPGWVYHGLICGSAADAVRLVDGVLDTDLLSPEARSSMQDRVYLGGAVPDRPWRSAAYGLGVMCGEMKDVGPVIGHSGAGPFSVSAVYRTMEARGHHTACAFLRGDEEGRAEWLVRDLLLR